MTVSGRKQTPREVLAKLTQDFERHLGVSTRTATGLLAKAKIYDKAYELSCLIAVLNHLRAHMPGATFTLANAGVVEFRTKGGPIDRTRWSYVEMRQNGIIIAELWVDIECLSLSGVAQGLHISGFPYGLAHELDIVVVRLLISGRPDPRELFVGIEAKHRVFNKALLKELLGVRRETAYHASPQANPFAWWSRSGQLPAEPASGIVAFCSDPGIAKYNEPAEYWGLEMLFHPG